MKSIVKWAGGKGQLLPEIDQRLPHYIMTGEPYTYIEPFFGSGAVAWHLLSSANPPTNVLINDINSDLINLYQVIKTQPHEIIEQLKILQHDYDQLSCLDDKKPYYYAKRDLFNTRSLDKVEQASLFVFLNRAGFNGLYRVNKNNAFNVPIGSYKNPKILFEKEILSLSETLKNIHIYNTNYQAIINHLDDNHIGHVFFYLDPPYRPISESSSFTFYAKGSFNDDNQKALKEFCDTLNEKSWQWLLSNSDPKNNNSEDAFFDDLYADYVIERVQASRSINANGAKRGRINELMIRNYK